MKKANATAPLVARDVLSLLAVVAGDRLYLRGETHLFRIAEDGK